MARVRHAWRGLRGERRLAAAAAIGLFLTLFLPWYQETVIPTGFAGRVTLPSATLTGWAAFSFVEAAVLLVAVGVLVLLFVRAEGRAFHVPGGDGGVITAAGFWTCVLILWRMFDKSGTTGHGQFVTTSGIEWGIFIALGVAALLAYAGSRVKLANVPEPPLPGERGAGPAGRPGRRRRSGSDTDRVGLGRPRSPRPVRGGPAPADSDWVDPAPSAEDRQRRRQAGGARRGLDFSELERVEFDEPPEAPAVRRKPRDSGEGAGEAPTRPQPPAGGDEQLTMRLDPDD